MQRLRKTRLQSVTISALRKFHYRRCLVSQKNWKKINKQWKICVQDEQVKLSHQEEIQGLAAGYLYYFDKTNQKLRFTNLHVKMSIHFAKQLPRLTRDQKSFSKTVPITRAATITAYEVGRNTQIVKKIRKVSNYLSKSSQQKVSVATSKTHQ